MPHISHACRRQVARQALHDTFSTEPKKFRPPGDLLDETERDRMFCEAVLSAAHRMGYPHPLWHLLDRRPVLIPMMVVVLDGEDEWDLLVELMGRYFPDEAGQ